MSSYPHFTLKSGGEGKIISAAAERVTLYSPKPAPPGATLQARIVGVACELQVKVRTCKKEGEVFWIEGRTSNATREVLNWLKGPDPTSTEKK